MECDTPAPVAQRAGGFFSDAALFANSSPRSTQSTGARPPPPTAATTSSCYTPATTHTTFFTPATPSVYSDTSVTASPAPVAVTHQPHVSTSARIPHPQNPWGELNAHKLPPPGCVFDRDSRPGYLSEEMDKRMFISTTASGVISSYEQKLPLTNRSTTRTTFRSPTLGIPSRAARKSVFSTTGECYTVLRMFLVAYWLNMSVRREEAASYVISVRRSVFKGHDSRRDALEHYATARLNNRVRVIEEGSNRRRR